MNKRSIASVFIFLTTIAFSTEEKILEDKLGVHFLGSHKDQSETSLEEEKDPLRIPHLKVVKSIDLIEGGSHAANGMRMKNNLEKIPNGVKDFQKGFFLSKEDQGQSAYAYLIGLETVSPLMTSIIKQVQTWSNQLNAINISSFEHAKTLSGGIVPKIEASLKYSDQQEALNRGESPLQALEGCDLKSFSFDSNMFLDDLCFLDSLDFQIEKSQWERFSGRVVFSPEKMDENYIQPPFCRFVVREVSNEWQKSVFDTLKRIQKKLLNENDSKGLSESESDLLNRASFPAGSTISLLTQYRGSGSMIALERISELISRERALNLFEEGAYKILYKAEKMRESSKAPVIDQYTKQVREALGEIAQMKRELVERISAEHQSIETLMNMDQMLRERERGI